MRFQEFFDKSKKIMTNISSMDLHGHINIGASKNELLEDKRFKEVFKKHLKKIKETYKFIDISSDDKIFERKVTLYTNNKFRFQDYFLENFKNDVEEFLLDINDIGDYKMRVNISGNIKTIDNKLEFNILNRGVKLTGKVNATEQGSWRSELDNVHKNILDNKYVKNVSRFFNKIFK